MSVPGGCHVDFRAHAQLCGTALRVEVEHDSLTLSQHAENGSFDCVGGEFVILHIRIAHDQTITRNRVIRLHDTLHVVLRLAHPRAIPEMYQWSPNRLVGKPLYLGAR